jgi:hypothetical protein
VTIRGGKTHYECGRCGVKKFRGGYFRYDRAKRHCENIDVIGHGFDSLAALAEKSSMKAYYQNFSTYNRSVPLLAVWRGILCASFTITISCL